MGSWSPARWVPLSCIAYCRVLCPTYNFHEATTVTKSPDTRNKCTWKRLERFAWSQTYFCWLKTLNNLADAAFFCLHRCAHLGLSRESIAIPFRRSSFPLIFNNWGNSLRKFMSSRIFSEYSIDPEPQKNSRTVDRQLLEEVFVISRIIKVEERVISLSLQFRLITFTKALIILDITKTKSNNCLILHWTEKRNKNESHVFCFFKDGKQHKAGEPVTLSVLDMLICSYDVTCADFKTSRYVFGQSEKSERVQCIIIKLEGIESFV